MLNDTKRFEENYQPRCIIWYQLVRGDTIVFRLAASIIGLYVVLWTTGAHGCGWGCWLGGYCEYRVRF